MDNPEEMITKYKPIKFPNRSYGIERNPEHAARAALDTRYTLREWNFACDALCAESDSTRNEAENFRKDLIDSGILDKRPNEGTPDLSEEEKLLRKQFPIELKKMYDEINQQLELLQRITIFQESLEIAFHIAQECFSQREQRIGVDKIKDNVEESLFQEIDNIIQTRRAVAEYVNIIKEQIDSCRNIQKYLEAIHLAEKGINKEFFVEKDLDGRKNCLEESQSLRKSSAQLRATCKDLLKDVSSCFYSNWQATNEAFAKRLNELNETKTELQTHLSMIQRETLSVNEQIGRLEKVIKDMGYPVQGYGTDEMSVDYEPLEKLRVMLHEGEVQKRQLSKSQLILEAELKSKAFAQFIDRDKCMTLRLSYPIQDMLNFQYEQYD